MTSIKLLTFTGFIKGLSAAALEAQYFDEYVKLGNYVENVIIVTAKASQIYKLPLNVKIEKTFVPNIPKLRGLSKIFQYVRAPFKFKREINMLYVRTLSPPEILSFWIAKHFLKIPCILMIGGTCFYEPLNFKNRIFRWSFSKALEAADKIVVYSERMIPFVKKVNQTIDPSKFEIVHNAVDEKRFQPQKKNLQLLQKMKIGSDEKIILFIGKISERKGVIDILKMTQKLIHQNVKVVFIGTYVKASVEFQKIEKIIQSLKIENKVIFLGKIPNNELVNYISCADVFVYLTKSCEGIPRAILECMSCGKPIVATPIAGIPDAVQDSQTGFIVENFSQAAEKVDLLLSDETLYNKISKNCRKTIENEFNYSVTLPKMVSVFKSSIDE